MLFLFFLSALSLSAAEAYGDDGRAGSGTGLGGSARIER